MSKILNAVLITIFNGLVYSWRVKRKPFLYIGIIITTILMTQFKKVTDPNWGVITTIVPYIVFFLIMGTIGALKERPGSKSTNHDDNEKHNIVSPDEIYPAAMEIKTERIIFMHTRRNKEDGNR